MGMDFISASFTHDTSKPCDVMAIGALLDGITDGQLHDPDFLGALDPSAHFDEDCQDEPDFPEEVRDTLKAGAAEYAALIEGSRWSMARTIPGTTLEFVTAGGSSWGDDPFEGFSELCLFIDALDALPDVAQAAGFVCGGLPDVPTITFHIVSRGG